VIAQGHDIEELFRTRVRPESVAAIVVEPLLGEGGYVIPPGDFLPTLRRICDEHGILLVADEVQCGMGRSGRMFAVEHVGVVPDLMTVAKALGNGLPIAALVGSQRVMSAWHPGEHGSTYGGNPIACAAAIAVLETIEREHLLERATTLGTRAVARMRGWQAWAPSLREVRGLGLWIGVEFREAEGTPRPDLVADIRRRAVDRGLLLLSCGIDGNVIRFIPPLTVTDEELDTGLDILEATLRETA
jgi:4-aminobutyrate aminotransferase-like enzyme